MVRGQGSLKEKTDGTHRKDTGMKEMEFLFEFRPDEKAVGITSHHGNLLILTDRRLYLVENHGAVMTVRIMDEIKFVAVPG